MRDSSSDQRTVSRGDMTLRSNGRASGVSQPLDRSYLLRRASRFPFPKLVVAPDPIRLRRARRVSASFTRIPPLSRGGPL